VARLRSITYKNLSIFFIFYFFLKVWWQLPLFLFILSFNNHMYVFIITFVQYTRPSPFAEASLRFLHCFRSAGKIVNIALIIISEKPSTYLGVIYYSYYRKTEKIREKMKASLSATMLLECANLLKRFCHEMNLLLKAYNIKQVLSVHALMVLIFCFLVDDF
jgi:hypothetical protein